MEKLIQLFNSIQPLSTKDIDLLKARLLEETLSKNRSFSAEGKVCRKLSFVNNGIFKVLKIDERGNQFIPYFITEGHFAVDIDSFTNQTISEEEISTITSCNVTTISHTDYEFFEKEIPTFIKIISLLKEKALIEKMKLKSEMLVDDALTKYQKLLKRSPKVTQQVPQGQIALFLGISQYTLSRIKSNA